MKECMSCGTTFSGMSWECPSCQHKPPLKGQFITFSPELAETNDGFEGSYFNELSRLEANHFWFRSRNRLILWALKRYFPKAKSLLEIGCGTGFVLSEIENNFPAYTLYGSEIYSAGLPFSAGRLRRSNLFQMDARRIPFKNEFDIIGAFDVLEHITEDERVLSQMYRALSTGGGIILTVPQHRFLWSSWDEISCHKRRYGRSELADKVREAGFKVRWITSFVTLLLPTLILSRLNSRRLLSTEGPDELKYLHLSPFINTVFENVCRVEFEGIKRGISLPWGGSLLCIGMKEEVHEKSKV